MDDENSFRKTTALIRVVVSRVAKKKIKAKAKKF